ncbi:MAG: hypothetical protein HY001_02645 [Candidatus Portnoybacteria bacterium]|nr:hypothetical protein [Candidatus Portnoybacteria bacterium]
MRYRKFLHRHGGIIIAGALASAALAGGIVILHQSKYQPSLFHVSCEDVGIAQPLWSEPRTGFTSTQFERRAMIEKRLFDCSWRAYRAFLAASKKDKKHAAVLQDAAEEVRKVSEPLRNYMNITVGVLGRENYSDYYVHPSPDAWEYSNSIFNRARQMLAEDPELVAGLDSEVMSFLGISLKQGVVLLDNILAPTASIRDEKVDKQGRQWLGLISNRMVFSALTPKEISLLDIIQALHTKWALSVYEDRPSDEITSLVQEHHQKHHELLMLAASADQQALFTLAEHSGHDVCPHHAPQELDFLLQQAEQHHQEWVGAVKNNDFRAAWTASLLHARDHALLATCNLTLPELTR